MQMVPQPVIDGGEHPIESSSLQFRAMTMVQHPKFAVAKADKRGKKKDFIINPTASEPYYAGEKFVAAGWNIDSLNAKRLPMYYNIQERHVVFEKAELPTVLARLQNFFILESLMVEYCDGNESKTVSARCSSIDRVEFVVFIWEVAGNQYTAEVQRTVSDKNMLFIKHRYAERILDTVKNTEDVEEDSKPKAVYDPLASCTEVSSQIESLLSWCHVTETQQQDAFAIIRDLLQSKRYDAVQCGLESLVAMTDASTSGHSQAGLTSRTVLTDAIISDVVISLASLGRFSTPRFDDDNVTKYHRLTALTVLAQAVSLIDLETSELQDLAKHPFVVDALLAAVARASQDPHTAYLATHILVNLCKLPECRDRVQQELRVFYHAKDVGKCTHAALAAASDRLLKAAVHDKDESVDYYFKVPG